MCETRHNNETEELLSISVKQKVLMVCYAVDHELVEGSGDVKVVAEITYWI